MDKALWNSERNSAAQPKGLDWRKRMSDHVAFALLFYTGLQIFVTMGALQSNGDSILPYFALVLLVAAVIPGARCIEGRWDKLSDEQAADPQLAPLFNRDRLAVWIMALGLPFLVTGVILGVERFL